MDINPNTITNAMLIADNLRTQYTEKRHGGYNTYKDDKICITLDTYYPNLSISIFLGESSVRVLSSSAATLHEYHVGAWEGYVNNELAPKALAAQTAKKQAATKRFEDERAARFRPISDAHIFNQEVA